VLKNLLVSQAPFYHISKWGWNDIEDDRVENIFTLIKDNEVDHLSQVVSAQCHGDSIAYLRLENNNQEIFELMGGRFLTLGEISPLAYAIYSKSFGVVKYFAEHFSAQAFREFYQCGSYDINNQGEIFTFTTPILPLILKHRDLDSLNYLAKHQSFIVTLSDLEEFVKWAIKDKWLLGGKAILTSSAAQVAYQSASTNS